MGDRLQQLNQAVARLSECGEIVDLSSIYETEPWGFHSPTAFLNQVIRMETALLPDKLLDELLAIEKEYGRTRTRAGYAARVLDIDILFYDDLVIEGGLLQIPHPRLHERMFVLRPLAEIAPLWIHPVQQKAVITLLEDCPDDSWIEIHQA